MEKGTARLLGGDREGFQLQSRRTHPSLSSTTPLDLSTQISSSITISANSDRTSKGETGYKGLDLLPLEISIEDVNPRALEPVALGAEMSGRRRREEGERVGLAPSHQRSSKSPRHLSLSLSPPPAAALDAVMKWHIGLGMSPIFAETPLSFRFYFIDPRVR